MSFPQDFKPHRTLKECDEIVTTPGAMLEVQQTLVRGVMSKVFSNVPKVISLCFLVTLILTFAFQTGAQNVRLFVLGLFRNHSNNDFIVFEKERWTYAQAFDDISRAASVFKDVYGIHKGDRVGIVMRNFPEVSIIPPLLLSYNHTDAVHAR